MTSFMKLLQKETKHVYQERRKLSILAVLDAKVTGLTKACVIKYVISDHEVYFCLNCEDWVKDITKVLDDNWTMFDERGNLKYDV